jgi:hypothetical protein
MQKVLFDLASGIMFNISSDSLTSDDVDSIESIVQILRDHGYKNTANHNTRQEVLASIIPNTSESFHIENNNINRRNTHNDHIHIIDSDFNESALISQTLGAINSSSVNIFPFEPRQEMSSNDFQDYKIEDVKDSDE